ncbi:MAG: SAM-dependent methyltransferase [Gammaproteobacteria bacterium]
MELSADDHTLDIGCGIGGASRFVDSRFGCRITGVNLTPESVSTGQSLCDRVGLSGQAELYQGDATETDIRATRSHSVLATYACTLYVHAKGLRSLGLVAIRP